MRPLLLSAAAGLVSVWALSAVWPDARATTAPAASTVATAPPAPPAARVDSPAGTTAPVPAGGGASGVRTTVTVAPYRVHGASHEALLHALRAKGPHVDGSLFFGLTTTEMTYRFAYREAAGACTSTNARVELHVTMTLPEWPAPAGVPTDLRRDWTRFSAALQRHEARHRDLAIESAHRLQAALDGLTAPTCDAVAAAAAREAERLQTEAEATHRAYDDATGHGETEGAVWPPQG